MYLIFRSADIRNLSVFYYYISFKLAICINNSASPDQNGIISFGKGVELRAKPSFDKVVVQSE